MCRMTETSGGQVWFVDSAVFLGDTYPFYFLFVAAAKPLVDALKRPIHHVLMQ